MFTWKQIEVVRGYVWENGGDGENEEESVGVGEDGEKDGEYLKGYILNHVS